MNKIKKPSLFDTSASLQDIHSKWKLVETLTGGTDAMRDAGRQYLPQNPKEPLSKYNDRLNRATLTNKYSRTIDKAVGKAFARKMNVVLPDSIIDITWNIDGQGSSLESYSKKMLRDSINYGIAYLLVENTSNPAETLAEQNSAKTLPYFVDIKPTQVLDLRTEYIGDKVQLTYFRFYQQVTAFNDTNIETTFEQVKEFILTDAGVQYNVYRKVKKEEILVDSGTINLSYIPIVPIYGKKTESFMGEPVLMDLAHLNIKHWWKQSDLDINEHYGLTPILALKGFQNNTDPESGKNAIDDFTISSSTVVALGDTGEIQWTNADASGIAAAQASLDRLLKEMDDAGLELTTKQEGGAETATGRILDASEANSILKGIVVDLSWQLYQAFLIVGDYLNIDMTDVDVSIDTSYTTHTAANSSDMNLLLELFKASVITLDELRNELHARKLFISEKVEESLLNNTEIINNNIE